VVVVAVFALLRVGPRHGFEGEDPDDPALELRGMPGLEVVEMDAADIQLECDRPQRCDADYLAFLERAVELGPGVGFLLEELDARELLLAERSNQPRDGIQQLDLVFEDPFVGIFEVLFLVPAGEPSWGGLVVHPLPDEDRIGAAKRVGGFALAAAGIAVAVVQPRLHGATPQPVQDDETPASAQITAAGFSLAGLHAYELVLLRKYLRWRPDVDPARIGLVADGGAADRAVEMADWAVTTTGLEPAEELREMLGGALLAASDVDGGPPVTPDSTDAEPGHADPAEDQPDPEPQHAEVQGEAEEPGQGQ
jgi:hypothetical protein